MIASATTLAASLQFACEDVTMSAFMRQETTQLRNQRRRGQPADKQLATIDVYRPMFASMVNLDDSIAKGFSTF